ncbi:hypothetical protein XSR1_10247 [Xenorhabdus szentirmaii DSM 16338]|uniref:Uncharacterized protein n=1 Tax=Xenorhabdus szentirmaii DSM 16338 TaxID=1427518 RepID=W1IQN0_9GAMM|nr:hypothetical protein XSR1_10247 [Xenorhabdus szentirmaii DSM 16338]
MNCKMQHDGQETINLPRTNLPRQRYIHPRLYASGKKLPEADSYIMIALLALNFLLVNL